ncbi:hypothetical protein JMJ78_0003726 [Colletotrichum scovillei]|nr:hypothetical protein JMJ78_0003726 [Colletotrichum scovillei]
MQSHTLQ